MSFNNREEADQTDTDVATVLRAYEAFARGDIDAAVADLDSQVDWIEPDEFPNGGRRLGPIAVAEYLSASREMWSTLQSVPIVYRRNGDLIVVHHVEGRLIDGTLHEATVADVFTVENGVIVRMQAFANPEDAFA